MATLNRGQDKPSRQNRLLQENPLRRLKTDVIDLFYQHRVWYYRSNGDVACGQWKIDTGGKSEVILAFRRSRRAKHPKSTLQLQPCHSFAKRIFPFVERAWNLKSLPTLKELGLALYLLATYLGKKGFFWTGAINADTSLILLDFRKICTSIYRKKIGKANHN